MQFGVCADLRDAALMKEAGADFIEAHVQNFLRPMDEDWTPAVDPADLPVPIAAYNCFLPGGLKVTGPDVDLERLKAYTERAVARAGQKASIIVFGSGGARNVPDGWPRKQAEEQLVEAMRIVGPIGKAAGLTFAMEPLRKVEANILNTVAEGLEYIRRAESPGISILCDFYHLTVENEALEHLDAAKGLLTHVHIAEPEGRVAPGPGMTDYRPFFAKLKGVGYDARISLECKWDDRSEQLGPTLAFLRREWEAA